MGLDKFMQPKKKKSVRDTLQNEQQPGMTQQIAGAPDTVVPSFVTPPEQIKAQPGVPGPAQIKKRTQERAKVEQIAKAPELKKPQDFDKVMKQIDNISVGMSPEQKKIFEERRDKIQQAKDAAQKQFEETKDTNQWLQVAETIGQALVQLGAGAYGLKHNIDMSGLRFNKTDWSKNIDRAERELDRKLGLAAEEERKLGKVETALERKLAEDTNFRKRAILQNFMAEQQAYKEQTIQAQRLAELAKREEKLMSGAEKEKRRDAKKELASIIRKQEQKIKILDKAYGEAQAVKEGEKNSSLEKVSKILGGEHGAMFREDVKTPVSIFGIELWKSSDSEEAPKVVKGYLDQAKAALQELKQKARGVLIEKEENKQTPPPSLKPGEVRNGYRFKGGNPSDQSNWEKVNEDA